MKLRGQKKSLEKIPIAVLSKSEQDRDGGIETESSRVELEAKNCERSSALLFEMMATLPAEGGQEGKE